MLRGVNTDMLTVDIIARQFRYVDANGAARRAAFPTNNDPRLDDLANVLASLRPTTPVRSPRLHRPISY